MEQDMSEEIENEEVETEVEEDGGDEPELSEAEIEASTQGWVPKDQFKGDPKFWRSAEEFLEIGRNELPVLRERNKKLGKEVEDLRRQFRKIPGQIADIERKTIERVTRELKEKQRRAVEEGDIEAFDAVDKELSELQKQPEKPQDIQPIIDDWVMENDWYGSDEDMAAYAQGLHGRTWDRNPETLEANLKMVAEKTQKVFAEKRENPNRSKPSAVENAAKIKTKSGHSYGDLPPEAKAICDELVAGKVLTKDQYVKDYFAGEKS